MEMGSGVFAAPFRNPTATGVVFAESAGGRTWRVCVALISESALETQTDHELAQLP